MAEPENCLLVSPVTLVCETLKHMDRDSAVGTLVIPDWPSSAFWQLLLGHYKNAIITFFLSKREKCRYSWEKCQFYNYLVLQTGRCTFMPSDLIFANRSLWCSPGAGLNAFSIGLTASRLLLSCHVLNPWAHREQGLLLSSSVNT